MPVVGKDYVTLVICTPYGLNSHRFLVRGERTDYTQEEIQERIAETGVRDVERSLDAVRRYYPAFSARFRYFLCGTDQKQGQRLKFGGISMFLKLNF